MQGRGAHVPRVRGSGPDPRGRLIRAAVAALVVGLLLPAAGVAQASDTVPVRLPGLRISVERLVGEAAGAARLVVPLDTLSPEVASTLEDVLRATPLIRIRRNARGQAQPFLRGGDDRQVAVLIDGVPITLGYDHRADLSAVPLSGARSLTLTRGPAPLAFGPNVTLGAIEIDLAGAAEAAPAAPGLRLAAEGSVPAEIRLEGRSGGSIGLGPRTLDIRGGGSFVDRSGFAVATPGDPSPWLEDPDGRRLASDLRRVGGFASARLGGPEGGWVAMTGLLNDAERGVEPETHVESPRFWRYPEEGGRTLIGSMGTPGIATPVGELVASLHGGLRTSDLLIEEYVSAAYDDVTRTERWDDRTTTVRGVVELRPSPTATVRWAGTSSSTRHLEAVNEGVWQRYRQRLWSGSLEATWSLGAAAIDVGIAMDAADTPASGDKPPLERQETWGARVGLTWSARPGLRLHTAAARRARFPSLRELYAGPLSRFEPNPDLAPERLVAVEGGATWTGRTGTLQVVAFHRDLADGIVRARLPGSGPPRFQRQNLDLVRSSGLEVLVDATAGVMNIRGDVTLQRVRGTEDGADRDVEYAPAVAGSLAIGAAVPWDVRAEMAARWESEQTCRSPGVPGRAEFSSDPSVDLAVRRGFRVAGSGPLAFLESTLRLDNVTNAVVFDQCGLPRPGRTVSIGVRVRQAGPTPK